MRERLKFFAFTSIFWITFFVISRIIFLIYHHDLTTGLTLTDILTTIVLGFRMDLAMTGYWLIFTGILLSIPLMGFRWLAAIQNGFTILLIITCSSLVVVDLELYAHWGFRMNITPFFYFSREAIGSVNPRHAVVLFVLWLTLNATAMYAWFKLIAPRNKNIKPLPLKWSPVMVAITALLIIPIRSSFSVAPLHAGSVYFHKTKSFPNHAGINVVWNFFNSFSNKDKIRYPKDFYTGDALQHLSGLERSARTTSLLNNSKPNVILIILESFTSNISQRLGGITGITPHLDSLTHEGILFDNFYASGDRTDKGLSAILSGYPAQPQTSIIRFPHKTEHLPFLSRSLAQLGYHTSFVYGGDIGFANMESYLTSAGFSSITSDDDFPSSLDNSKWGVADEFVFERLLHECDSASTPFFKVMLSLSSHEPFEVPMKPVLTGNDERSLFLNACIYTDRSLGTFIAHAKKQSWWRNTLVIITADHGHRFPKDTELKEKERFKIPMLWIGGAITAKDSSIHTIGGQTDISNTVLSQLDRIHPEFIFSRNITDPKANPWAMYIFQNGFGYLDPQHEYIYDFDQHTYVRTTGGDQAKANPEAYMQVLFNDYNSR